MTNFWFHFAECMTSPLKVSSPGIFGQEISFKAPRAESKTSASSFKISPVFVFSTHMFLCHSQRFPSRNTSLKHLPFLRPIIPRTTRNLMFQFHMPHNPIFIRHSLQIRTNFFRRCIERRPIRIGIERELVGMGRNIAGTPYSILAKFHSPQTWHTRISILPPRPTYSVILLVYL